MKRGGDRERVGNEEEISTRVEEDKYKKGTKVGKRKGRQMKEGEGGRNRKE